MSNISAIVITYNEEKNISDCLKSLSFCKEIILVDSFSQDKTIEICKNFNKVYVFQKQWAGFSADKNFALQKAVNEWIFWLDADERVSEELKAEIIKATATNDFAAFSIPRKNIFLNKWLKYGGWYPDGVIRLFKKSDSYFEERLVHEKLIFKGTCGKLKNPILHLAYNNISQYIGKQNKYGKLWARENKEIKKINPYLIPFKCLLKFIETYIYKRGFLDGSLGFIAALLATYATFVKYFFLWEEQSAKK